MKALSHRVSFQGLNLELLFFPRSGGNTVDKIRVAGTLGRFRQLAGLQTVDKDGHRQLGGHSLRLAGPRLSASLGLHLYQIELMARGSPQMLLRYKQTADSEEPISPGPSYSGFSSKS